MTAAALPGQLYYGPSCRFCGSVPAVEATFRGHQGFLVIMRFLKLRGPFCRSCGIAVHRKMTADSAWQGWWGIASMLINPITMLANLPNRAKVNKLGMPVPGAPGQPMDPGKPLFRRAAALGLLVPLFVAGFIVYQAGSSPSYASTGDCVYNRHVSAGTSDSHPDVQVVDCSDPKATAKVIARVDGTTDGETACHTYDDADAYYTEDGRDSYTLCLRTLR